MELTVALLKPSVTLHPHRLQTVHRAIVGSGFQVLRSRKVQLSKEEAQQFYKEHDGKFFYRRLVDYTTSSPLLALVLARQDAIPVWRSLIGNTKVYKTHIHGQETIRGLFGVSDTRNAAHGADSEESARRELQIFFPQESYDTLLQDALDQAGSPASTLKQ